ncbi:D-lactaldehyde dehydrogenase [Coprinellus micaceus]|uniref:D-lactaldehyde dehydrogenase n=1 Tax=Coprinellus micaceus TaxID=71717 RepID=A0A4Y7SX47_COPMI|nr:D-lactaldehyde dehydrogenase [Coprinellus micaceus]
MPVLTSTNSKVLVTGANGYIGAWVVKILLDRGYSVRAAVRNSAKADILRGLFPSHAGSGKLEFAYVADLVTEGAFDDAVVGVDAILHLASPLPSPSPDPQATIRPAVDGTLGVLKSALKNGEGVKRIGITSSTASLTMLAPVSDTPTTFSEADWNDAAIRAVQGGSTNPFVVYAASKTLAEKAAWEFHNTHKPAWDIATLNPPFVYGPTLLPAKTPAEIGGTQGIWYGTVIATGNKDKEQLGEKNGYAWVDVRDIAEAHVRALEKEEAGGQRIVVSSGSYIWQEWFDVAKRRLPGFPELTPGDVTHLAKFDNAKSERVLGLKYRAKEDTVRDILEDAAERGWLAKAD